MIYKALFILRISNKFIKQALDNLKVFVYGTLKPGEGNYQRYCAGKVVKAKRAIAQGLLFALPVGYPAMTPGDTPVHGFLLTFANSGILLELDQLEDYHPSRPVEQNEYYRQQIITYDLDGRSQKPAWAYLMTFEQVSRRGGVLLPAGWWSNCGFSSS